VSARKGIAFIDTRLEAVATHFPGPLSGQTLAARPAPNQNIVIRTNNP